MTHVNDMSNSNSVIPWQIRQALYLLKFVCLYQHRNLISIPMTIIRWLHDKIARTSRSFVAFVRQSGSFFFSSVLSSWVEKCPIPPIITRSNNDDVTIWQDAITMTLGRPNGHTKSTRNCSFARNQRFCLRSRSCCRSLKKYNRRSHNG